MHLHRKAFSEIRCTTKLARTSQYHFVLHSLHKELPSTTLYYKACTEKAFTHSYFFRREAFTHSKLFKQRSFYTLLHTTSFTQRSFYTQQAFTHRTLLHRVRLHMASVYTHTEKLLHTSRFTHRKLLHTANFYRKRMTPRSFLVHNDNNKNYSSKTGWGSRRQSKKTCIEVLFLNNFTRKSPAPKLRKSSDKSLSQP